MIHNTFLSHFHTFIDPPNKEDLLYAIEKGELDENQEFTWNNDCAVTLHRLSLNRKIFFPSIQLLFKEISTAEPCNLSIDDVWRNTYHKGSFQEIHDHLPNDLSGVLFLDDHEDDFARLYFHNRHDSEWSHELSELLDLNNRFYIKGNRGQILFFPSHMMHGVSIHKSDKPRRTVSFNISIAL